MAMGDIIARLSVVLGLETAAFEKGATIAEKRMAQTQRNFEKLGKKIGDIGSGLTKAITLPVAGAGAAVLKMSGDFEGAMNRVSISTQGTAAEMKAMSDLALQIGKDTTFGATEAAGAMDMLAKNGLAAKDILGGAAKAAVDLAQAGGAELAPAADAITDVMQQFKVQARDLPMVVNQITGAVNESKLDFDDFALAIGQAGGVAGSAGVEFDDFNAALAGTSSLFASGSDAGTSFKTFLTQLTPNSKPAREAIEDLGLKFFDAEGRMRSMAEIAEELRTKLGGLSEEDRTATLKTIFGVDAMRTAIGLMDQGAAGIDKIKAKIAETDAAAQSAQRLEGFNGQLENLKGAVETLAIRIGQSGVLEAVTGLVTGLADFVDKLSETNPEILKWGAVFTGVLAVLGPVAIGLGAVVSAVGVLTPAIVAVGGAFATFAAVLSGAIPLAASFLVAYAPILAPIAAIAAAVAGVYLAWKNWDKIVAIISNVVAKVRSTASEWVSIGRDIVAGLARGVAAAPGALWSALKNVISTGINNSKRELGIKSPSRVFMEIGSFIGQGLAIGIESTTGKVSAATKKMTDAVRKAAQEVQSLLARLFPEIDKLNRYKADLATIDGSKLSDETKDAARSRLFREAVGLPNDGTHANDPEWIKNTKPIGDAATALEDSMERVYKATGILTDKTKTQTVQIAESFKDMATETMTALKGLVDGIKKGDFFSILDGVIGLVLQLGSTGLFGKGFAKAINSPPAYATGTSFHPGGLAMVGERGPELVSMPRGSKVYTNSQSRAMMGGGGGVTIHVDARDAVLAETVKGWIAQGMSAASQAGAEMGMAKMMKAQSRSLAR